MLAATARSLGADDPRTDQQRRSDLFADLLLGRLAYDNADHHDGDDGDDGDDDPSEDREPAQVVDTEWLEIENIDPDTGELLGTHLQPIDANGQPVGEPVDAVTHRPPALTALTPKLVRRPRTIRIGVVVPLSSLLNDSDTPAELADRSGFVPGEVLREHIADAINPDTRDQVLFTRLLTDDGGRLLNTTELGRYPSTRLAEAIKIRAGTCRYPTCTVPADRCDLDHHEPVPRGRTSGTNHRSVLPTTPPWQNLRLASLHSETTTASTGPCPTPNTTDAPTNHYPPEGRLRDQSWPGAESDAPSGRSALERACHRELCDA